MKKIVVLLVFAFGLMYPGSILANNTSNSLSISVGNVTGTVVDVTGLGIAYASVELLDEEGKVIDGVLTLGDGTFSLVNKDFGKYTLRVTVAGLEPYEQIVEINQENVDLGTITLASEVTELDGVVTRGETSKITTQIDRRVVEVGKDLVSAGATASEVLNNIPSLNVDQQSGELSLRGNSNIRVFVDGKPSSIPVAQLLKQLPSNSIAKVEIITNPSAKYNPEGNSGIINIITNKEKSKGYNIGTTLGYTRGAKNKYNASINGNVNTGKLNLFANYNAGFGENYFRGNVYSENTGINQKFVLPSEYDNHLGKIGFDWFINEKTAMTIYTNQSIGNDFTDNTSWLNYSFENENYTDISIYDGKRKSGDYSLNFSRDFEKKGHNIEIDAFYSNSNSENTANFDWQTATHNVTDAELANTLRIYDQFDERTISNGRLKVDYTLPFKEKGKIETGFNFNNEANENELLTSQFLPVYNESGQLSDALEAQDTYFDFTRNIYALYLNLGYQWEKIGMQVGVRGEHVNEDILTILSGSADIDNTSNDFNRNQQNFYPSAFFTYQATEKDQFSVNYSRRVDRPGVWQLSPVRSWQTATIRQEGNPDLKPQFTDSYELGYLRTFGNKGNLNASVFYRKIHDNISQLIYEDEVNENISILKAENIDDSQSYGAEVSWYLKPNSWWSLNGGLNLYFNNMKSLYLGEEFEVDNTQFTGRLSNDFSLTKSLKLQLFTMYMGSRVMIQGRMDPMFRQDIGLRQTFAKGNGTISARLSDIFNTFYGRAFIERPYVQGGEFRWESRTLYVGLSYNFGGKVKTRADKQQNKSESGNSGGIGF